MHVIKIAVLAGIDIKKMVDDWNDLHRTSKWITEQPIWLKPSEHARFLKPNDQGMIEYTLSLDLERDEQRVYMHINNMAGIKVISRYSKD